jgi:multidrug efflux pump subunit AcrA (membrane-fusion protein)
LAEPGHVVAAGEVVVRLAHAGPREATINLPETLRPAIGSTATATLYSGAGQVGSARLRQLSDAADAQTRTFETRYVLEGAAAGAPLGSTVSITVADSSATAASATQVPLSAIYDNGHGPGVWSLVGGKAGLSVHWIPVTISGLGDETATVTRGLSPGQRFVALGAHMLHEGEPVVLSADKLAVAQ